MKRTLIPLLAAASLLLSACSGLPSLGAVLPASAVPTAAAQAASAPTPQAGNTPELGACPVSQSSCSAPAASLAGYQAALENIYTQVNPSVVSIRVVHKQDASASSPFSNLPGFGGFSLDPNQDGSAPTTPQYSQALGSGFVWDTQGHIVTNNHVVDGADKVEIMFADGTSVPATRVGADPDSDLAVVQVKPDGLTLSPITLHSGDPVKVGQLAVAIGNPYGLENTMTVGIVSALGRTLPASSSGADGVTFTIPGIIQTDAPINPGNSGGPLLDDQGALIGVNSAIESSDRSNAGIGFAIPFSLVSRVVPALISSGSYPHPYLGISGLSLTPSLAEAMKLDSGQRGVLVIEVNASGPADDAGLQGSDRTVTIDGQQVKVGGDVITAIDGSPVRTIEDLITYLGDQTSVGQAVTLTFLRAGREQTAQATLQARPAAIAATGSVSTNSTSGAWLGIAGLALTPEISAEMKLPQDQAGVLVEQVQAGSPADQAGLRGSFKPVLIHNQRVLVGGDVITAVDGKALADFNQLKDAVQAAGPGAKLTLALLRDGSPLSVAVTLAAHP